MRRSCCLVFLPVHTKLCNGMPTLGGLCADSVHKTGDGKVLIYCMSGQSRCVATGLCSFSTHPPCIRCCLILRALW